MSRFSFFSMSYRPYFDYAITRAVGGGTLAQVATFALSNLLSAALKLKRCCIVISNLAGTYAGATKQLSQAIYNMQQEANRQAKAIVPVELASQENLRDPAQAAVQQAAGETGYRCRCLGLWSGAVRSGQG